jgi:hypothetical protein
MLLILVSFRFHNFDFKNRNPNIEIKQSKSIKIQMIQTKLCTESITRFKMFRKLNFGFVSNLGFRASDLLSHKYIYRIPWCNKDRKYRQFKVEYSHAVYSAPACACFLASATL